MFGVNAFGWPYFGQGYVSTGASGPAPTADVVVLARPDVTVVYAESDVAFVDALADVQEVVDL